MCFNLFPHVGGQGCHCCRSSPKSQPSAAWMSMKMRATFGPGWAFGHKATLWDYSFSLVLIGITYTSISFICLMLFMNSRPLAPLPSSYGQDIGFQPRGYCVWEHISPAGTNSSFPATRWQKTTHKWLEKCRGTEPGAAKALPLHCSPMIFH